MSQMQPVRTLKEAKYSFDHVRNAWFCGKKPVNEEDVRGEWGNWTLKKPITTIRKRTDITTTYITEEMQTSAYIVGYGGMHDSH